MPAQIFPWQQPNTAQDMASLLNAATSYKSLDVERERTKIAQHQADTSRLNAQTVAKEQQFRETSQGPLYKEEARKLGLANDMTFRTQDAVLDATIARLNLERDTARARLQVDPGNIVAAGQLLGAQSEQAMDLFRATDADTRAQVIASVARARGVADNLLELLPKSNEAAALSLGLEIDDFKARRKYLDEGGTPASVLGLQVLTEDLLGKRLERQKAQFSLDEAKRNAPAATFLAQHSVLSKLSPSERKEAAKVLEGGAVKGIHPALIQMLKAPKNELDDITDVKDLMAFFEKNPDNPTAIASRLAMQIQQNAKDAQNPELDLKNVDGTRLSYEDRIRVLNRTTLAPMVAANKAALKRKGLSEEEIFKQLNDNFGEFIEIAPPAKKSAGGTSSAKSGSINEVFGLAEGYSIPDDAPNKLFETNQMTSRVLHSAKQRLPQSVLARPVNALSQAERTKYMEFTAYADQVIRSGQPELGAWGGDIQMRSIRQLTNSLTTSSSSVGEEIALRGLASEVVRMKTPDEIAKTITTFERGSGISLTKQQKNALLDYMKSDK